MKTFEWRLRKDGMLEGCVLIFSCENMKIKTSCWTINRRTLNPPKKISQVQGQRRSYSETVGRAQSQENQIPYLLGLRPTDWRVIKPNKFLHCWKVLGTTSDFPTWGSSKETGNLTLRTVGFDYRTPKGLGETETLGGYKQYLVHTRTQGKGAVTPHETKSYLPVSIWGSPVE